MSLGEVQDYQGALGAIDMVGASHDIFSKIYNDTGAAITNGAVYWLSYEKDADSLTVSARPTLDVPASAGGVYRQVVVVNNGPLGKTTIADADWGYVQIKGFCPDVACAGAVAIDHFLQCTDSAATATDDGASITVDSFGITVSAAFNTTHNKAVLFGETCLFTT
jgi:hypothetical protein